MIERDVLPVPSLTGSAALPEGLLDGKRGLFECLTTMALHDLDTFAHLFTTAGLARRIVEELGFSDEDANLAVLGALMHDIGKIHIPLAILSAPRPLTKAEWALMRDHPVMSAGLLMVEGETALATVVIAHHEFLDGSGYPDGLKGRSIPLATQVISVVDAYDTMRHGRPYKAGRAHDDIMTELTSLGGVHYDPEIVASLGRIYASAQLSRATEMRAAIPALRPSRGSVPK